MNKREKIEIIIFVALIIVFAISLWVSNIKKSNLLTENENGFKVICKTIMCRNAENGMWVFDEKTFYSLEECIAECKLNLRPQAKQ